MDFPNLRVIEGLEIDFQGVQAFGCQYCFPSSILIIFYVLKYEKVCFSVKPMMRLLSMIAKSCPSLRNFDMNWVVDGSAEQAHGWTGEYGPMVPVSSWISECRSITSQNNFQVSSNNVL